MNIEVENATRAGQVYDVLVEIAGAPESGREQFVQHFPTREWRFMGLLGFGGKVWVHGFGTRFISPAIYVTCYPEEMNAERQEIIELTNARLLVLTGNIEDANG